MNLMKGYLTNISFRFERSAYRQRCASQHSYAARAGFQTPAANAQCAADAPCAAADADSAVRGPAA